MNQYRIIARDPKRLTRPLFLAFKHGNESGCADFFANSLQELAKEIGIPFTYLPTDEPPYNKTIIINQE